jgi:hypothetical protein
MFLYQLRDDLVLLNELRLELLQELGLKLLRPRWPPSRALQSTLRLVKHLLDPRVDLAGLDAEVIGELGDRLLDAEMTPNDLSFLGC